MIARVAERGASVTERLLAFAHRSELEAETIDVTIVLSDLARLLGQTLGSAVTVRVEIEARIPPLFADRGQLETVLINLATNARDAMSDGGILTFSAKRITVARIDTIGDSLPPGHYIRIRVSDTGTGMDEVTLGRATEPFFTTKLQGEGTGLGLSMAKGFAEQSGGSLTIQSNIGRGTTIDLLLPEADNGGAISAALETEPELAKPRILLVDDDLAVLDALRAQLEAQGYAVACADGGLQAMSIFDSTGPDLLLTDFVMPQMDGITLIENLQARRPELPAILITGYSADRANRPHAASFRLIRKPASAAQLREVISSCLHEGTSHARHVS
jgi:CheY-like chemotaxis protein